MRSSCGGQRRRLFPDAISGAQHANLFGNDSALALSFTTSPEETSRVKQYGASWRLPIYPLGGVLSDKEMAEREEEGDGQRFCAGDWRVGVDHRW